jgi:hypothetical protein
MDGVWTQIRRRQAKVMLNRHNIGAMKRESVEKGETDERAKSIRDLEAANVRLRAEIEALYASNAEEI